MKSDTDGQNINLNRCHYLNLFIDFYFIIFKFKLTINLV